MTRTAAILALVAALFVGAILTGTFAAHLVADAPVSSLRPCPTEDYDGPDACFWDAGKQGNHAGQSFEWTGKTIVYYTR